MIHTYCIARKNQSHATYTCEYTESTISYVEQVTAGKICKLRLQISVQHGDIFFVVVKRRVEQTLFLIVGTPRLTMYSIYKAPILTQRNVDFVHMPSRVFNQAVERSKIRNKC